jgi:hypothetical protein
MFVVFQLGNMSALVIKNFEAGRGKTRIMNLLYITTHCRPGWAVNLLPFRAVQYITVDRVYASPGFLFPV